MITPIGSMILAMDNSLVTAMDAGIAGLTAYLGTPVTVSVSLYYLAAGIRIVQGDGGPIELFVGRLVRNIMILWLCTSAAAYNQWVRNIAYDGLPAALNAAILSKTLAGAPSGAAAASVSNGLHGTAATCDQLTAMIDQKVGMVLQEAGLLDFSSRAGAILFGFTGGLAVLVIALVYELSRFAQSVVLILGLICLACLTHDVTKPVFERFVGKVIALVFVQVTAIVVLQITLTADQTFLDNILHTTGGVPDQVQGLMGMVLLLFMSAFGVIAISAIAYSLGSGVAVSALPALYLAAKAMQAAASAMSGMSIALPAMGAAAEELSLGLASAELSGGSVEALAPPALDALPPPPLSLPGS